VICAMKGPMAASWALLKSSRQTTLGEFHQDLPSPYGPVTMFRGHPKRDWPYKDMVEGYEEEHFQPYEDLIREGLRPIPVSLNSLLWEMDNQIDESGTFEPDERTKPFDFDTGPGNWFSPAGGIVAGNMDGRGLVGVRMPIDELKGLFRNRGYLGEPAEAYIQQHIPAERLVQIPYDPPSYRDYYPLEGPSTWGKRGE